MHRKKFLTAALCFMLAASAHLCVSASEVGALDEDMPPIPGEETQIETVGEESEISTEDGTVPDEETQPAEEEDIILDESGEEDIIDEEESETDTEDESEEESEEESESESESESEDETELILEVVEVTQYALDTDLVPIPEYDMSKVFFGDEYRFTQVDKKCAVVCSKEGCQVYEGKGDTYRVVGEMDYYGICYVLKDEEKEWVYIESGNVRGFVNRGDIVTGDVANRIISVRGDELTEARLTLAKTDNAAFTYTTTTVNQVVVDKVYALAAGSVNIYEQKKTTARVTGQLPEGGLCYILEDTGSDWVYVESGDARGFVQTGSLIRGDEAAARVAQSGEESFARAQVLISPRDNRACYYTLTSVQKASTSQTLRETIVNYALQFVGNPYVWGGTSLTHGADCSGFVQTIYAQFGYYIPRVTWDQAAYCQRIPISEALPGDLIFYFDGSTIYHVSMYIGNGAVVQAANSRAGIITSGIGGHAVYAGRVIQN